MKRNHVFSIRNLVMMAALIAMQIILARFLSIQVSEVLRISFETLPLALAGIWLGPVSGALVALISDVLGVIISGYGVWFPPIALGPIAMAVICGVGARYVFRSDLSQNRDWWKVIVLVSFAGIINAFGIGPITTTFYQMLFTSKEGTFGVLLAANLMGRLAAKPLTIAAVALLTYLVNKTVYKPVISRIVSRA